MSRTNPFIDRYTTKFGARTFAEQFYLLRTLNKMTQRAVARESDIPQSTISLIESGKVVPNTETLQRLRRVFPDEDFVQLFETCRRKEIESGLLQYRDLRDNSRLHNQLEIVVYSSHPEDVKISEIRDMVSLLGYLVLDVEVKGSNRPPLGEDEDGEDEE